MLYQMLTFNKIHRWCQHKAVNLMDVYEDGTLFDFTEELTRVSCKLRGAKYNKRFINSKVSAIRETLTAFDMILEDNYVFTPEHILAKIQHSLGHMVSNNKQTTAIINWD